MSRKILLQMKVNIYCYRGFAFDEIYRIKAKINGFDENAIRNVKKVKNNCKGYFMKNLLIG